MATANEGRERILALDRFLRAAINGEQPDFLEFFGQTLFNELQAWHRRKLTPAETDVDARRPTPEEEKRLRSSAYQEQLADALMRGITRYFAKNPPLARSRSV